MNKNLCVIFAILFCQFIYCEEQNHRTCSRNSANWCKNVYEAKACNVVEHCWKYVWSDGIFEPSNKMSNDLVDFTLYYETLCPDCKEFTSGQLINAIQSIGSIMNLTLVPYGNAKETWRNETKLWQFTCQHGSDECWANLLHTCLIYFYPATAEHFPFIHCMESNNKDDVRTSANKCAAKFNITMTTLTKCMNSVLGNNLEHQMALKTDALVPVHKYVPWVTLNGVHTEDIQQQAEDNLIALICNAYKGSSKPDACNNLIAKRKCINH